MEIIQQILADFYHCTGLSAHFFNEKGQWLESIGETQANKEKLQKKITAAKSTQTLTEDGNTHYLVIPFAQNNLPQGYVVGGPYQSACIMKPKNIPFKPDRTQIYFGELLTFIIKQNVANAPQSNNYIAKAIEYIEKNYQKSMSLPDICDYLNLNVCYFCKLFKTHTGQTFNNYVNQIRIEKSTQLLRETQISIIDISLEVGFNNPGYFTLTFKKFVNMTPRAYRVQYISKSTKNCAS